LTSAAEMSVHVPCVRPAAWSTRAGWKAVR